MYITKNYTKYEFNYIFIHTIEINKINFKPSFKMVSSNMYNNNKFDQRLN